LHFFVQYLNLNFITFSQKKQGLFGYIQLNKGIREKCEKIKEESGRNLTFLFLDRWEKL